LVFLKLSGGECRLEADEMNARLQPASVVTPVPAVVSAPSK
jgi:hypothetical protein